jgi:hypothetical protein
VINTEVIESELLNRHITGIQQALETAGGTHALEDVLACIERGEAQLWIEPDALIVSEIIDTPQLRELRFWISTGELEAVIELGERVLVWGREMGCKRAVMTGRMGWKRLAAQHGWQPEMIVIGREL